MALPPTITDGTVTLTFGAAEVYYGYCTILDVTFEFPNSEAFTTLDHSTVAQEITYAAQEIQDQLAHAYQMPYAGTDSGILLTLRDINAKLATANIIDRYFQGSTPNHSAVAADRRHWAELMILDVLHGSIRWDAPFGDAIAQSQLAVYNTSTGATVVPNPSMGNEAAKPIFVVGRSSYRRSVL